MGFPDGSHVRVIFSADANGGAVVDQNGVHIEIRGLRDIGAGKYFLMLSTEYVPETQPTHEV